MCEKNREMEAQKQTAPIATSADIYPLTIMKDRYSGVYSEGAYLAFNDYFHRLPKAIAGSDGDCISFWSDFIQGKPLNYFGKPMYCGRGKTSTKALNNLIKIMKAHDAEIF